jgi:hypothetical protein
MATMGCCSSGEITVKKALLKKIIMKQSQHHPRKVMVGLANHDFTTDHPPGRQRVKTTGNKSKGTEMSWL